MFARKANQAIGPTEVVIPTGGFSVPDAPGQPFWDPEADGAFIDTLRAELAGHVRLTELDHHINDDEFIDFVLSTLITLLDDQPTHPAAFARSARTSH